MRLFSVRRSASCPFRVASSRFKIASIWADVSRWVDRARNDFLAFIVGWILNKRRALRRCRQRFDRSDRRLTELEARWRRKQRGLICGRVLDRRDRQDPAAVAAVLPRSMPTQRSPQRQLRLLPPLATGKIAAGGAEDEMRTTRYCSRVNVLARPSRRSRRRRLTNPAPHSRRLVMGTNSRLRSREFDRSVPEQSAQLAQLARQVQAGNRYDPQNRYSLTGAGMQESTRATLRAQRDGRGEARVLNATPCARRQGRATPAIFNSSWARADPRCGD